MKKTSRRDFLREAVSSIGLILAGSFAGCATIDKTKEDDLIEKIEEIDVINVDTIDPNTKDYSGYTVIRYRIGNEWYSSDYEDPFYKKITEELPKIQKRVKKLKNKE
ncbi:MAG TPA: hypothetical protein P5277_04250 [Candidatus Paceibacterota bacterium]|nr:hypothetical protein [Candidatus Paceibacterota bacterium]